jgi:hypothetical protein
MQKMLLLLFAYISPGRRTRIASTLTSVHWQRYPDDPFTGVDLLRGNIVQKLFQFWLFHVAAGEAAIVTK